VQQGPDAVLLHARDNLGDLLAELQHVVELQRHAGAHRVEPPLGHRRVDLGASLPGLGVEPLEVRHPVEGLVAAQEVGAVGAEGGGQLSHPSLDLLGHPVGIGPHEPRRDGDDHVLELDAAHEGLFELLPPRDVGGGDVDPLVGEVRSRVALHPAIAPVAAADAALHTGGVLAAQQRRQLGLDAREVVGVEVLEERCADELAPRPSEHRLPGVAHLQEPRLEVADPQQVEGHVEEPPHGRGVLDVGSRRGARITHAH
jgi:hypothetical protein